VPGEGAYRCLEVLFCEIAFELFAEIDSNCCLTYYPVSTQITNFIALTMHHWIYGAVYVDENNLVKIGSCNLLANVAGYA
jgi:hypothetical protein